MEANYIECSKNLTVEQAPIITINNFVNKVNATFDFSKVPTKDHQIILKYLMSCQMNICLTK